MAIHPPTEQASYPKQFKKGGKNYIPASLNDIIGQQATISKARVWLEGWDNVHRRGIKHNIKKPFSIFGPVGDLNSKAMLFSGSPGLGKTTVARLLGA